MTTTFRFEELEKIYLKNKTDMNTRFYLKDNNLWERYWACQGDRPDHTVVLKNIEEDEIDFLKMRGVI